ncbi:hypothetical protein HYW41_03360 [Candidatus Daviesbacteria bacterium]|nr:hypothetical protein [Candidatus Daviesbacteria bacterium]MBI4009333.1 hypothetical protein [Candidatus Roizmanbacteria bacterium]
MNALTEEILETLSDLAFHPHRLFYGRLIKEYSRKSLGVTVRRLEQKGYIERGVMEDEVCIKLTELGTKKLTEKRNLRKEKALLNLSVKDEKWDGKWRIVIFDIPEVNKRIRQALRETLKVLEFWPLQKSVWISKKNYTKELRKWITDLDLSKHILTFETKDLGNNN